MASAHQHSLWQTTQCEIHPVRVAPAAAASIRDFPLTWRRNTQIALLAKAFQVREQKQWRINDGTSMKSLPAVCLLQWFLTRTAPQGGFTIFFVVVLLPGGKFTYHGGKFNDAEVTLLCFFNSPSD